MTEEETELRWGKGRGGEGKGRGLLRGPGWACAGRGVDDDRGGGQGLCPTPGAKKGTPTGGEQGLLGADMLRRRRRRDAWKNLWAL